jgi:hypothetical protein
VYGVNFILYRDYYTVNRFLSFLSLFWEGMSVRKYFSEVSVYQWGWSGLNGDFIRWLSGVKRLTTSGFGSQLHQQESLPTVLLMVLRPLKSEIQT